MTLRIFLSVLLFIAVLLSCQEFGVSLKNEQVKKLTVAALTGEPENYAPTLKMAIDSLQSKSYWLYNESINPVVSGNLFSMLANNEKSHDSAASYNRQALYYYDLASKSRPVSGLNWSSMAYVTERINKEDKRLFDCPIKKSITPSEKEILINRPSRSAKLRYGIRNNKKYFFPNELTEKFKDYLEIEGMGSHL